MAASKSVQLPGLLVEVRELTVREVRDMLMSDAPRDAVRAYAFEDFSLDDLAAMTDCPANALDDYAPSDLEPVVAAAKLLNPHFFRPRAALSQVARTLAAETWPLQSTDVPVGSSRMATQTPGHTPGQPTVLPST